MKSFQGRWQLKITLVLGMKAKYVCVCVCVFLPVFDVIMFLLAFAFSIMHAVYGSKLTL